MRRLAISKEELRNFRGHKSASMTPNGADVVIAGRNGTGKTTFADAWFWVWTGKDSLNRSDFDLKIQDKNGQVIHNLEYGASMEFLLDGEKQSLSRTLKEKWETTRGLAKSEFKGHTTDIKINSVPTKEQDFLPWMAEICDPITFRRLSDPVFVLSEPWQTRRKLLLEVCGDLTDAEVIAATPELKELPNILGKHKLDDYKKILKGRKEEVTNGLKEIPARIDELDRLITEASLAESHADPRPGLQKKLSDLQGKKARIEAGGEVAEFRKKLSLLESEEIDCRNRAQRNTNVQAIQADEEANQLQTRINNLDAELNRLVGELGRDRSAVDILEARLVELRAQKKECTEQEFVSNVTDCCPTCLQPLPEDQVAGKIEEARKQFNAAQSAKLTAIRDEGLAKAAKKKEILDRIDVKEQKIAEMEAQIADLREKVLSHRSTAEELRSGQTSAGEDKELTRVLAEIAKTKGDISLLEKNTAELIAEVEKEIGQLTAEIRLADQAEAKQQEVERNKSRQEELGKQQQTLSAELEKIEHETYLCEKFIKAKVDLLDKKINSRFKFARFTLSEVQINGGIKECCDCTYLGLPPSHGETIKLGLDIINVLAEHYGLALPVFIDNVNLVTDLPTTLGQQIRLFVAETDLTINYVEAAKGAA